MRLLRMYLRSETADLHRNNVKLSVIGERSVFSEEIKTLIQNAETLTIDNTGLHLIVALNYGGRMEIVRAASSWALDMQSKGLAPSCENAEEYLPNYMMTRDIPDPDILIRTSGEQRISNFLLWQCAYTEFIFTETLWPDFDKANLEDSIKEFQSRERRFGAVQVV